jgi:hypothetical protein
MTAHPPAASAEAALIGQDPGTAVTEPQTAVEAEPKPKPKRVRKPKART